MFDIQSTMRDTHQGSYSTITLQWIVIIVCDHNYDCDENNKTGMCNCAYHHLRTNCSREISTCMLMWDDAQKVCISSTHHCENFNHHRKPVHMSIVCYTSYSWSEMGDKQVAYLFAAFCRWWYSCNRPNMQRRKSQPSSDMICAGVDRKT